MKVIRLNEQSFDKSCKDLGRLLKNHPIDLIIGIETGGAIVANSMIRQNGLENIPIDSIKIRRKSSSTVKNASAVKKVINQLPEFLIRFLRRLEMYLSEVKSKIKDPEREVSIDLKDHSDELARKGLTILIVDDALDTGKTMKIARDYFVNLNSANRILTAVLTVTHRNPLIIPDFTLHKRTILQFPWSLDSKV